jgi:hypothetical protein
MEEIVEIRLLFVAGLLVMSAVVASIAHALEWLGSGRRMDGAGERSAAPGRIAKEIPLGGTR